ncbi:class I SAM-dependent methyltransferase [Burkholderia cenocepacia]|uniref:class I SAM-dependent methyltransferase n=1 Tax=Burkholderia cenocepacia TaxID=95486 RepID=UPI000F5A100A|nr:class I SAM-dependent methyltransferase [Burkholderia cenocepacia]RQV56086.1 class I SAM-dependent methyltransferase [Burkholderia cenocepacia]
MVKAALKALGRPIWTRMQFRMNAAIDGRVERDRAEIARLSQLTGDLQKALDSLRLERNGAKGYVDLDKRIADMIEERIFVPPHSSVDASAPFMRSSSCSVSDMVHPRYAEICRMIGHPPKFHRKLWEWVFIVHHLESLGMLTAGNRGVGFGVGQEPLPALFASRGCDVVATDAPPEIGISSGWSTTGQHAAAVDALRFTQIVSDEAFNAHVSHQFCDMTKISDDLTDFDFTWSSCCFEHLGSLEAGIQFVIDSVEKTLKPGGVAVHTTEFNLISNDDTVDSGPTVIYRKRDIEELAQRLRARGHDVMPIVIAPNDYPLDFHVDAPPYINNPHIKLRLSEYTTTSIGIVVRRSGDRPSIRN